MSIVSNDDDLAASCLKLIAYFAVLLPLAVPVK